MLSVVGSGRKPVAVAHRPVGWGFGTILTQAPTPPQWPDLNIVLLPTVRSNHTVDISTRTHRMPSQESASETTGRPSTVAQDEERSERSAPAYVPDTDPGPELLGLPRITC